MVAVKIWQNTLRPLLPECIDYLEGSSAVDQQGESVTEDTPVCGYQFGGNPLALAIQRNGEGNTVPFGHIMGNVQLEISVVRL